MIFFSKHRIRNLRIPAIIISSGDFADGFYFQQSGSQGALSRDVRCLFVLVKEAEYKESSFTMLEIKNRSQFYNFLNDGMAIGKVSRKMIKVNWSRNHSTPSRKIFWTFRYTENVTLTEYRGFRRKVLRCGHKQTQTDCHTHTDTYKTQHTDTYKTHRQTHTHTETPHRSTI